MELPNLHKAMTAMRRLQPTRAMLPPALMILAAGWLVACSGDSSADFDTDTPTTDTDTFSGVAISFGGGVSDSEDASVTRSTALSSTVTTFKLWGYKNTDDDYTAYQTVFPGYTVTYEEDLKGTTTDNTAGWYYVTGTQTIKYWDYSAYAYRFMAYAETSETYTVTSALTEDATKLTFTLTADATSDDAITATPYISTLWFSNNSDNYPLYGDEVELTFLKPFSKVRIMLLDESGKALTDGGATASHIDASKISFTPTATDEATYTKATLTVTYPITSTETSESLAFDYDEEATTTISIPYETATTQALVDADDLEKWYTVIPNPSQGSYTFSVKYNGSTRTATVPSAYMAWQAGYEYTYVFKLSSDNVSFSPELSVYTKWQTGYSEETTW